MRRLWVQLSIAVAAVLVVVGGYMTVSAVVAQKIRTQVASSLSCVVANPTIDLQTWRILPGLATGDFGTVKVAGDLSGPVAGTVDATIDGVKRANGTVTFDSGRAVFNLRPPTGVHAHADGTLSFGITGVAEAFVHPTLQGSSINLELEGLSVGGEKLGGTGAPLLEGQTISPIDLSALLPDGTKPTGLKISDNTLSVSVAFKPTPGSQAVQFCAQR